MPNLGDHLVQQFPNLFNKKQTFLKKYILIKKLEYIYKLNFIANNDENEWEQRRFDD